MKDMIEKIDISNPSIAEAVRKQMVVVTSKEKGLLSEKSERFIRRNGLNILEKYACIKLYSSEGRSAVSAVVTTGRIEGDVCASFILSYTIAIGGTTHYIVVKRLTDGMFARFYYVKNGDSMSIYLVTSLDYSITNAVPLIETGFFTYHLTKDTLPEGAIEIPIS